ncbi:MAG: hypothetical protein LQ339_004569 [Xanthoria mediterranea]|nr:MAG: hypothetical protein LQ339_004569 [Xanthoria mediterranea]
MTIELGNGFNPESHLCLPGSRLTGHVVIRNPKVLSVDVVRVTIYGISDAYIHRSISGIRADFYGRGFLFQEIKNLTASPVTLEPNLEAGHRLPFEFTVPSNTTPMSENTKNFTNKWQRRESFAGAQDMHTLPPSFSSRTKALLGHTDSSISYRIDATCTKAKGCTSWLPQASMPLHFSPTRSEHNPEPRLQTVRSQHQTKSTHAPTILLHIPSISYAGGPFPVMMACEGLLSTAAVILTSLEIRLEGIRLTRGQSFLFGEKECSEGHDIPIIASKDFSINIGPEPISLMNAGFRSGIPQNAVPTFKSFTVTQMPYIVHTSYTVRIGNETIKGKAPNSQVKMLPGVVRAIASS